MEEKSKEVQMNGLKDNNQNQQKLSYEQLNEACAQLYQQNQNLMKQLQQVNMANMFKRLDYLFMVVKYKDAFGDDGFAEQCIAEIKDALTVAGPGEEEESKEG